MHSGDDHTDQPRPSSLTAWLRARTDEQLAALIDARPDVAVPAPADLSVLVNRLSVPMSIARAVDGLDAFTLWVLRVVVDAEGPVRAADLRAAAGGTGDVDAALAALRGLALVWGDDATHPAGSVRVVLGGPAGDGARSPAELLRGYSDDQIAVVLRTLRLPPARQPQAADVVAAAVTDPTGLASTLAGIGEDARGILARLTDSARLGAVHDAIGLLLAPDPDSPISELLTRGLLIATGPDLVELPYRIAGFIRGDPATGARPPSPPQLDLADVGTVAVDTAAASAAAELLRLTRGLLDALAEAPPRRLRTGGLGVRELRRFAREFGMSEPSAGLLLEVADEAGLLGVDDEHDQWLPALETDVWARSDPPEQWSALARAWLRMRRLPWLIGQRDDRDRVVTPLSAEAAGYGAPGIRATLLGALAALPAGCGLSLEQMLALMRWRAPRSRSVNAPEIVRSVLDEAETLGVTARGALSSYGRVLLDGADPAKALASVLPEPVDHVLVQADLTAVAPGPLRPDVAEAMAMVADVESSGAATVYRIGEDSIRRAMDAGRSAADLHQLFAETSRTPVPQGLTYLIDDVGRRHGVLRVGRAATYLRCDDTAVLAEVAADRRLGPLQLRRLAPTVLLCKAPLDDVLALLRAARFAPVAESADGAVIASRRQQRRAPASRRPGPVRDGPVPDRSAEIVRRLRAGDAAAARGHTAPVRGAASGVATAGMLGVLQEAISDGQLVLIGYVNAQGTASSRIVEPTSVAGGVLRGYDHSRDEIRTFALHRIVSAVVVDDEDTDGPEWDGD